MLTKEWYRCFQCTTSTIDAINFFKKLHPGRRKQEIENFIRKVVQCMEDIQMPHGSWYIAFSTKLYIIFAEEIPLYEIDI